MLAVGTGAFIASKARVPLTISVNGTHARSKMSKIIDGLKIHANLVYGYGYRLGYNVVLDPINWESLKLCT